ncbi:MAG TPA: helix-turn-helix transcriptional regulator [Longimicrobium sp.]|nr:helix-turn-helix transcriptional regulator [Longimicrobium sp.]
MPIRLLPKQIIGRTIRGVRTRLGMSAADFARSLGVSDASQVGKWERGTAQPDYGTLAKIAAMGAVDLLVFHEPQLDGASPQLTPGEASELNEILARMEALLTDARRLVKRATERTALDLLEATAGTAPAQIVDTGPLVLEAGVTLEARPRTRSRTAQASRRAASTQTRSRTSGGTRKSGSSEGSSSGSGGSSSGSTARSGGSRSSSSRSVGGQTRASGGKSSGGSTSSAPKGGTAGTAA